MCFVFTSRHRFIFIYFLCVCIDADCISIVAFVLFSLSFPLKMLFLKWISFIVCVVAYSKNEEQKVVVLENGFGQR